MITKYRLNPCDCSFNASDYQLRRMGYPGTIMCMVMDLVGRIDPVRVAQGLRRAMEAHPATLSSLWISTLRAWPYWRYHGTADPLPYRCHDLSVFPNWQEAADRIAEERISSRSEFARPFQVALEHCQGPGEQHRLFLLFQHALMDVEGAQMFMAEVDRLAADHPAPRPAYLLEDHEAVDPLGDCGLVSRLAWITRGVSGGIPSTRIRPTSRIDAMRRRPPQSRRIRHLERFWSGKAVERIRNNARKIMKPGAGLYGRYIAVCVIRAIYRIHLECKRKLPFYGTMFPIRIPGFQCRAVPGNFLVSPSLSVKAKRMTDRRAVAEDVDRQLREYMQKESYKASWAMMWLTAQLRTWQYRLLTNNLARTVPLVTGYSFWGPLDPPMKEFVGARVSNLWGYGVVSIPPGWNPVFCRYEDKINLSLAWPDASFSEEVVRRYADLIEEEIMES